MMMRVASALLAFLSTALFAAQVSPQDLTANTRVTILLTTLSYDIDLKSRGGELRIGVLSATQSPSSQADAKQTLKALEQASSKRVKGLGIVALDLPATSAKELKDSIRTKNINIIYLSNDLGDLHKSALDLAKDMKILTICGEEKLVKAGAAFGAVLEGNKPKILVNLKAAEAQGAKLDARLLRLVKVIE